MLLAMTQYLDINDDLQRRELVMILKNLPGEQVSRETVGWFVV